MNAVPDLNQRVALLEDEVHALRQRVTQLEQVDAEPAEVVTPPAAPAVEPKSEPPVSAMPPPLPVFPPTPKTPPPLAPEISLPRRSRPEPAPAAPPPLPREPSGWQELLGTMKLLPPKSGESGEAQIGGWWATRVGALLAVIGVVFFGIYISANIAPWMKWLELAAIAGGVLAGGHWLERRGLRVGPVIIGAGHALVFFTAFAASSVEAVRIVSDPVLAVVLQAAAAAFIAGAGWRRDSATTATIGIVLGYVSAFFSLYGQLPLMAGAGGVVLAMAAVALQVRKSWWGPVFLSAVLTPLLCLIVCVEGFDRSEVGLAYGLILAGFVTHLVVAVREGQLGEDGLSNKARRLQAVSTSLSLLAGFVATVSLASWDAIDAYFLGSGLVLLAAIAGMVRLVPGDRVIGMWAVKTASLLALAAIAHWDAHSRWVALMVEALVLVAAAQRSGRNSLRAAAIGAWAVSLAFFLAESATEEITPFSAVGWIQIAYVGAGLGLFEILGRQWRTLRSGVASMQVILGVLATVPLMAWFGRDAMTEPWGPTGALLWALVLAGVAWQLRSRVMLPALVVAFGVALLTVFAFNESLWSTAWLWAAAGPLGLIALVAGWKLARLSFPKSDQRKSNYSSGGISLVIIALATVSAALMQTLAAPTALAVMAALAVALAASGLRESSPVLTLGAMASLLVSFALRVGYGSALGGFVLPFADWVTLAGVPLLWIIGRQRPTEEHSSVNGANAFVAIAGVPLIHIAIGSEATTPEFGVLLSAIGLAFGALAVRWRVKWAWGTASAAMLIGLMWAWVDNQWMEGEGAGLALAGMAVLILSVAAFPLLLNRLKTEISVGARRTGWVIHALVAAAAMTDIALNLRAVWADYGTVLWGIGGIVLFALGIAGQARVHRVVGLILLVLCIPRAFVHDIEEAKDRIAAFIVLGVLLLWVGFSYQKFRHLIESPQSDKENDSA